MKIILEISGEHNENNIKKIAKLCILADAFSRFHLKRTYKKYAVSIMMCDQKTIQELNLQFQGKNKPTNVLSFPCLDVSKNTIHLGDIAICDDIVKQEAIVQEKTYKDHFNLMLTHSILHLLGYDHMNEEDRAQMEMLEDKILSFV